MELRSAGELSLIREPILRAQLADYYVTGPGGITEDYILRHVPESRETIRGLMPSLITKYVWAQCHKDDGNVLSQRLIDCEFPMTEYRAKEILDSFIADPGMLKEFRFWISTLDTTQGLLANNQSMAQDLIQKLKNEMNR